MSFSLQTRVVRRVGWAGALSLAPYATIKTYWACGGRAGMPPEWEMVAEFRKNGAPSAVIWMERHGLDFTALLAAVGAVLVLALAWDWGRRLPSLSLLIPAWSGAVFFVPYGLLAAVFALAGGSADDGPSLTPWIAVAGVLAFCGVGGSLGVCAWSYRRRTHP
ncbi:hypothetical protein AB0L06_34980 [Spirillospora sp. NPDC052269]